MSDIAIDRVLIEASPGETRAVGFAGEEAWEIAQERPLEEAGVGDIYWARAGAEMSGGGRYFDLGGDLSGMARKPRRDWTDGAMGLVQVLRPATGGKGPRVTDRVWLRQGVVEVAFAAAEGASLEDRIEIARTSPKPARDQAREQIAPILPPKGAVRLSQLPAGGAANPAAAAFDVLANLGRNRRRTGRVFAAGGEIGWLIERWPEAVWVPADLSTAAWLAQLDAPPAAVAKLKAGVAQAIDAAVADALTPEIALPGGARLWVEPTKALVAIDVDRAAATAPSADINRAAAREAARQVRLRRLGGIVAVDFLREGLSEGLSALRARAADDPWGWTPPRQAESSGLVVFQRARSGRSLAEIATGIDACAHAALRAAVRVADRGETPFRLRAPAAIVERLKFDLRPSLAASTDRLGRSLDLERTTGVGSIEILGANAEVLDAL